MAAVVCDEARGLGVTHYINCSGVRAAPCPSPEDWTLVLGTHLPHCE